MKTILTLTLFILCFFTQAQDCSIMQSGNFSYEASADNTMTITATTVTDYSPAGNVVSTITWTDACSYTATIQTINVADFPYNVGDEAYVTINSVDGNNITITTTLGGNSWSSVLVKG